VAEGLKPYLDDNVQAWDMQPDGSFRRAKKSGKAKCAQMLLLKGLAK
jgi:polyphosphate kinase